MVPVQSGGSAPGLFFVHPDESTMLTLRHFRGPLGPDQRVVGLLPERIGRRFDQSRRVEDLATPMLEAIRSVQPHGPYHIAGFSFGGLLAYELAGRLREDGEPVGWLAILDCMTPEVAGRLTWLRSPRGFLTRLRERGARRALRAVRRGAWRALEARLGRLRRLPTPVEDDFDFDGAAALRSKYICRGHDAPLELFVSADTADMTRNPSLGVGDRAQGCADRARGPRQTPVAAHRAARARRRRRLECQPAACPGSSPHFVELSVATGTDMQPGEVRLWRAPADVPPSAWRRKGRFRYPTRVI